MIHITSLDDGLELFKALVELILIKNKNLKKIK